MQVEVWCIDNDLHCCKKYQKRCKI